MKTNELYLKTVFCCMACDGNIVDEEISLIHELCDKEKLFDNIDIKAILNQWISEINRNSNCFIKTYLDELKIAKLSEEEELNIINIAIRTIEADKNIEYTEIKFFKSIRKQLAIEDDKILLVHPDKKDFLLPDINTLDFSIFSDINFQNLYFNE